jgi:hypothetical protein
LPLLVDMRGEALAGGDILRLSDNYDTGPGSGPVDLMVYSPRDDEFGEGLIVASGHKAGLIFAIFPKTSIHPERRGLSVDWLVDNWDQWFRFTYHPGQRIPVEKARVLRVDARSMPEET